MLTNYQQGRIVFLRILNDVSTRELKLIATHKMQHELSSSTQGEVRHPSRQVHNSSYTAVGELLQWHLQLGAMDMAKALSLRTEISTSHEPHGIPLSQHPHML